MPGENFFHFCENQSAAVPFGALFFWFVHSSFAILSMAQWLSKNHAHSFPLHGISINNPSVLIAVPNFKGQHFFGGIKKSRFRHNEAFLVDILKSPNRVG